MTDESSNVDEDQNKCVSAKLANVRPGVEKVLSDLSLSTNAQKADEPRSQPVAKAVSDDEDESWADRLKKNRRSVRNQIAESDDDSSPLVDSPIQPFTPVANQKTDISKLICSESDETVAKEIKDKFATFTYLTTNIFKCRKRFSCETQDIECDCTLSRKELASGKRGCTDDCLNRLLMIECRTNCSLGRYCGNKQFQLCDNAPVSVFKTSWKGFGLKSTQDIVSGRFLLEYVGEVLDERQFRKRAKMYGRNDVQHFYFMSLTSDYYVDASAFGNVSRFINHSCDPNAETQKWTVNGEVRVGFFARRVIEAGEEITFDYKYERYGQTAQKCYCGSTNCRGWLGDEPDKYASSDSDASGAGDSFWSSTESEDDEEEAEVAVDDCSGSRSIKSVSQADRTSADVAGLRVGVKTTAKAETSGGKPRLPRPKPLRSRNKNERRVNANRRDFEAEDVCAQIGQLQANGGVRTKQQTVLLCRLMFTTHVSRPTEDILKRASKLLALVISADEPCRRLFIDYHGLRIIHGWMMALSSSESGQLQDQEEPATVWKVRRLILDALKTLPISNKAALTDSKVWSLVSQWAEYLSPEWTEISSLSGMLMKKEWSSLSTDVFRIPRREKVALRNQHEREADAVDPPRHLNHHRHQAAHRSLPQPPLIQTGPLLQQPLLPTPPPQQTAPILSVNCQKQQFSHLQSGISRFDDKSGLLHLDPAVTNLSRQCRRELFMAKAEEEANQHKARAVLVRQHAEKCQYLGLDPSCTPMFEHYPEFYLDLETQDWVHMPPRPDEPDELKFDELCGGLPKMALLSPAAFCKSDPPLPNPAYYYPPGVVEPSYMYSGGDENEKMRHLFMLDDKYVSEFSHADMDLSEDEVSISDVSDESEVECYASGSSSGPRPHPPLPLEPQYEAISPNSDSSSPSSVSSPYSPQSSPDEVEILTNGPANNGQIELVVCLPPGWECQPDSVNGLPYFYDEASYEATWCMPKQDYLAHDNSFVRDKTVAIIETADTVIDESHVRFDPLDSVIVSDETVPEPGVPALEADLVQVVTNEETEMAEETMSLDDYRAKLVEMRTVKRPLSREERSVARKQKRDKERKRRHSEKHRRIEKRNKHIRSGLVNEYFIPRLSEKERQELKLWNERLMSDNRASRLKMASGVLLDDGDDDVGGDGAIDILEDDRLTGDQASHILSADHQAARVDQDGQLASERTSSVTPTVQAADSTSLCDQYDLASLQLSCFDEIEFCQQQQQQSHVQIEPVPSPSSLDVDRLNRMMTLPSAGSSAVVPAPADTSSEVARKARETFVRSISKFIVRLLMPYMRPEVKSGHIQSHQEFKHLARKLTQYITVKEMRQCSSPEELRYSDSVRRKSKDYVRKYMARFSGPYTVTSPDQT